MAGVQGGQGPFLYGLGYAVPDNCGPIKGVPHPRGCKGYQPAIRERVRDEGTQVPSRVAAHKRTNASGTIRRWRSETNARGHPYALPPGCGRPNKLSLRSTLLIGVLVLVRPHINHQEVALAVLNVTGERVDKSMFTRELKRLNLTGKNVDRDSIFRNEPSRIDFWTENVLGGWSPLSFSQCTTCSFGTCSCLPSPGRGASSQPTICGGCTVPRSSTPSHAPRDTCCSTGQRPRVHPSRDATYLTVAPPSPQACPLPGFWQHRVGVLLAWYVHAQARGPGAGAGARRP